MVEALDNYEGGNDSLLYAIQDYDRDRACKAENKARKAGEKATREAEECLKTNAENKEDDPKEEFITASLLKKQKALQQRKAEWEAYGQIIFDDVFKSKIMLELKLFEFSKEDELDDSIEIDDEKENGIHAQQKEMEEWIQEMDHYQQKFMEYVLDEEDRQIVLACKEIETKILTDLRIRSEMDECLKQQMEIERELDNEMLEKDAEEMIQDMNEYELKFLEYVHDEEDREILLACEHIEMKIATDLRIQSEVDEYLKQQMEIEREVENEMLGKDAEEMIQDMNEYELKFLEYVRDEEDREILLACEDIEMKITRDLQIQSEVDQCLRQQTEMERELENEMLEKEAYERMNEMYTLKEKYGKYILNEEDREIIRIADETERGYVMNVRNEPGTSGTTHRGKKRGAQQATTAIGTEDPESTVSLAKNRRRRSATH